MSNLVVIKEVNIMSESNRKTHTSTAVKRRYAAKVYESMRFDIPKALAAAFRQKCASCGVSMAGVVKNAMSDFVEKK